MSVRVNPLDEYYFTPKRRAKRLRDPIKRMRAMVALAYLTTSQLQEMKDHVLKAPEPFPDHFDLLDFLRWLADENPDYPSDAIEERFRVWYLMRQANMAEPTATSVRNEPIAIKDAVPEEPIGVSGALEIDPFDYACEELNGVGLAIFRFLHGRREFTYFDELRDAGLFTKDSITDRGIETAIVRLRKRLDEFQVPYYLEWSKRDRRVKLVSKSAETSATAPVPSRQNHRQNNRQNNRQT